MKHSLTPIDHTALKINQIAIILLNIAAFILDLPWAAAVVTAAMLAGSVLGVPGFGFLYRYLLKPSGLAKPHVIDDHPEPHRFAQGFGGSVMLAGTAALFLGWLGIGWSLVWLVTALAALNAFGGFCAGCFVYYWLARWRVPGFDKLPPNGVFPGVRPGMRTSDR